MKIDASSYAKIAKEIGVAPQEILFLTDMPTGILYDFMFTMIFNDLV